MNTLSGRMSQNIPVTNLSLDYPMSSTLSLENRLFKSPARTVLGVFSLGGVGYLTMGIWYLILLAAFKHGIQEDIQKLQYVWRLLFGIGLIPLCLTLYFRLIMPESPAFVKCMSKVCPNETVRFMIVEY